MGHTVTFLYLSPEVLRMQSSAGLAQAERMSRLSQHCRLGRRSTLPGQYAGRGC